MQRSWFWRVSALLSKPPTAGSDKLLRVGVLMPWCTFQTRALSRMDCVGLTAKEIIAKWKVDRVIRPKGRIPSSLLFWRADGSHQSPAARSKSLSQEFPRELLGYRIEELEKLSQVKGKAGSRARKSVSLLMSPAFDRPR
mmetsp:Transcript_53105/g.141980  ORF Transcript_53105/g.141980 Transcript_53105/m.141980 type:complete len:140 (-) Transcript_53105:146-565(-)